MKRKASATKNNGHAKFGPFFCFHLMNNPLTSMTFGYIDELERNVFLKMKKMMMMMKLEPESIVMWRWLMLALTERVMHQKLKSKLEQVD